MPTGKKPITKRQRKTPVDLQPLKLPFAVLLILLVVVDIILKTRQETFETVNIAFYAWFSAICCILLVGTAHLLHKLIKRHEKYYQREAKSS